MKNVQQNFSVYYSFPVIFTRNMFDIHNSSLPNILKTSGLEKNRLLIVIDSNVFKAIPDLNEKIGDFISFHSSFMELVSPAIIIKGGETCKNNLSEINKIYNMVDKYKLCRHSFIIAIGGGAVLDATGYAAATAHRGIRLIRLPTTTLAQNDMGVAVKNGINAFGRKNFIGTFTPPYAVINDFEFLKTLKTRALRSGISEAVKVALIKDGIFFDFLYNNRERLAHFIPDIMEKMIIRCSELHIDHIKTSGDPFENGISRPLDFGHWSAHNIEEITHYKLYHGEAVAIGIALDSLYSNLTGLISTAELDKIFSLLEDIGFKLYHESLADMKIDKALKKFQEHLGGELTIPLLSGIGNKIDAHEIDTKKYYKCIEILAKKKRKANRYAKK